MTDFLQFLTNKTKLFKPAVPIIEQVLDQTGVDKIVDLGSGGGGGLIWISKELQKNHPELRITMTDLYPNISAFEYTASQTSNVVYRKESIDARKLSPELSGLRTLFLSLHHFRPDDARAILQDAVDQNRNIAIFEAQERSLTSILAMLFSPISVLLTTPFIRPFKWGRIVFTFLIPLVPVFVLWDGIVSSLRTYSVTEMNELVAGLRAKENLSWKTGRIQSGPGTILYLTGTTKSLYND